MTLNAGSAHPSRTGEVTAGRSRRFSNDSQPYSRLVPHRDDTHRSHDFEWDAEATAVRAEMEGEVLAALVEQALDEVVVTCAGRNLNVRRVLDLGCGPGVATTLIAGRFPRANVVAADGSAAMLEHARARSRRFRVDQRVNTHRLELPAGLDTLDPADVVWASMVLHHVGNELAALRQIRTLLEPGGLLALVEHDGKTRVLPDDVDVGRTGLWERLDEAEEAWFRDMRTGLPDATESASHAKMLGDAGFHLLVDRMLEITLEPPLDDCARRFAHSFLQRTKTDLEPYANRSDLQSLDRLLDEESPDGILKREDAVLSTSRHLYVASAAG